MKQIAQLSFLMVVLGLGACAMVPERIRVEEGQPLVNYSDAVVASQQSENKLARWGGIIVGVENKPERTLVEIVHFPLNHYAKPQSNKETVGRFKAVLEGFVDPILFEQGRLATFVGKVGEPEAGMVGEQPYLYPTLVVNDYHFWRKEQVYDVQSFNMNGGWGWGGPFFNPLWGPGWGWGGGFGWGWGPGMGLQQSRVRVIERGSFQPALPNKPDASGKKQ